MILEKWDRLTDEQWDGFAERWAFENSIVGRETLNEEKWATDREVFMNFTASVEAQWKFILAAFKYSDDRALMALAAGPVEHLLSHHGEVSIERVEELANSSSRFAYLLTGCWKNAMTDEIWARVCKARAPFD